MPIFKIYLLIYLLPIYDSGCHYLEFISVLPKYHLHNGMRSIQ